MPVFALLGDVFRLSSYYPLTAGLNRYGIKRFQNTELVVWKNLRSHDRCHMSRADAAIVIYRFSITRLCTARPK